MIPEPGAGLDGDDSVAVLSGSFHRTAAQELRQAGCHYVREFAVFPAINTARWLLPLELKPSTVSGLGIYAPYKRRGRFFKQLLSGVARAGWAGAVGSRVCVGSKGALPLEMLVTELTGERHPVFALSLGTPGSNRKLTAQVMRPTGEILGYIKLPLSETARERVRHEAAVLERLQNLAGLRKHIPKVLHSGAWGNGYLLFQSAGPHSLGPIEFGRSHTDFLQLLWNAERVEKPGCLLLKEVADCFRIAEPLLNLGWRELGKAALSAASWRLQSAMIPCGVMHGDFAPWNTRTETGRLFLFDWESAAWDAPNLWDVYHFHAQVKGLLNMSPGSAVPSGRQADERGSFLLYLLSSACRYFEEKTPRSTTAIEYRRRSLAEELSRG